MDERYQIRPGTAAEAPELSRAESICFSDPWSAEGIAELFENESLVSLVARARDDAGHLAGYIFARSIAGEAEILSMAVLPDHRRKGVGALLLTAAVDGLRSRGAGVIFLEVRESNQAARELYRLHGFQTVGLRSGYYRNPRENALLMRRDLELVLN